MTGPEHYRAAEQLTEQAGAVMDYEHGMYARMDTAERLQRRACLLAEAQIHATLAAADMTASVVDRLGDMMPARGSR